MKRLFALFVVLSVLSGFTAQAQIEDGIPVPDYPLVDLDGNVHDINQYLAEGKTVFLEVIATWAVTCWNYHNSLALQDLYSAYGPGGTDQVVVIMVESDPGTDIPSLYGVGNNTAGDYMSITPFPVCNVDETFNEAFSIGYYPTIYTICMNGLMYEVSQLDMAGLYEFAVDMCVFGAIDHDAGFQGGIQLESSCNDFTTVTIKNYGVQDLTECIVVVQVNGSLVLDYDWTGSLSSAQYETINLGNLGLQSGDQVMVTIDYPLDENNMNNAVFALYQEIQETGNRFRLEIMTDSWPMETSWKVRDGQGDDVITWGDYFSPGTLNVHEFYLPSVGCYEFVLFDSFGDGLSGSQFGGEDGSCVLYELDADGNVVSEVFSVGGTAEFFEIGVDFGVNEIFPFIYSVSVFNDLNANGNFDDGESLIPGVEIHADNMIYFTGEDGSVSIPGPANAVSIHQDTQAWPTNTTAPLTYPSGLFQISLMFGISAEDPYYDLSLLYTQYNDYFCNFETPIFLNVSNEGNTITDAALHFVLDDLLTLSGMNPAADEVNGNVLSWNIEDLAPGQTKFFWVYVEAPNFEAMGEIALNSPTLQVFNDADEMVEEVSYNFEHVITCSYDPNDKQVWPAGETEAGYVPNGTEFEYLVRFQNTGNAAAFNVRVDDVLDTDLDWSTLEILGTSHYCEPSINLETGLIEFFFPDIMLPDSTTNEPESHGFIRYKINALPDLLEGTEIENTAYIYFDFNPAVITNTTLNTVSDLFFSVEEYEAASLKAYPNPTEGSIWLASDDLRGRVTMNVMSSNGQLVRSVQQEFNGQTELDLSELPAGLYLIEVNDLSGVSLHTRIQKF